jgi:PTS system ascorbate-specific IIC component
LNFPKGLAFLKEISITGGIVVALTYVVMTVLMYMNGIDGAAVFGLASASKLFSHILLMAFTFGAGLTVLLLGVRMVIAEIVPAFKGFSDKIVPGAIPALDCPMLFAYAPNALVIGFITAMITSVITIILTSSMGFFQTVVLPLTITCFFELGTAAIIGNATGGVRGAILGSAVGGVIMVFLVGFGAPFFMNTINQWLLVFGGQDFSIWGIIAGLFARLFA